MDPPLRSRPGTSDPPGSAAGRLSGPLVDRAVLAVIIGLALVSLVPTAGRVTRSLAGRQVDVELWAAVCVIGCCAWMSVDLARGRPRSRAATLYAWAGLVAMPLTPLLPVDAAGVHPEAYRLASAAVCAHAMLSRSWWLAVLVHVAVGIALREPLVGWPRGAVEAILSGNMLVALRLGTDLLRAAADALDESSRRMWRTHADAARARHRLVERERWRALVHDKVLGAFQVVGRRRDERDDVLAAQLASDALRELSGLAEEAGADLPGRARDLARRLGVTIEIDASGTLSDAEAVEALWSATEAAMTNAALHSGCRHVDVSMHLAPDRVRIRVADRGQGFDVGEVPAGRLGVTHGIRRRMTTIGGAAHIESEPGRGTLVELAWDRPPRDVVVPVLGWGGLRFLPVYVLGVVSTLSYLAIGALQPAWSTRPWLAAAAGLGIIAVTCALAFLPTTRPAVGIAGIVASAALLVVLTADLVDPSADDGRFWFVGALDAAAVALALRWPIWTAPLFVAAMCVAMSVAPTDGGVDPVVLAGPWSGVLAHLVPALGVRLCLDAARRTGMERDARAAREEFVREAALERTAQMTATLRSLERQAVPMLRRIAAGPVVEPGLVAQCVRLERSTRDELLADLILDDRLRAGIDAARSRGVEVELMVDGLTSTAREYRELLVTVLAGAPAGSRVRARYRADASGRVGSVVVVQRGADHGWVAAAEARARTDVRGLDLWVWTDEDSALFALAR